MGEAVAERVRDAIRDHGPIGFDEYMELALYGPGGFFETPPVGSGRHFVTSPHVHPFVFAHCLRDAILDAWFSLGEPDPIPIAELGAGDGTLARAVLDAFGELPRPRPAYSAVEISAGAHEALRGAGVTVVASAVTELPPFEGVAFANELLDNLPFIPVRGRRDGPVEVRVDLDGTALVQVEVPWARSTIAPPRLRPGEETTVPAGAWSMLDALARRLRRGYVLLIDFGRTDGPAGSVHGYRDHRRVDDVLSDPGGTDITAGVDVAAVTEHARSLGLWAFEPVSQAAALSALGHDRWEASMRETQSALQRSGRGAEAVRVWEDRSRASLLSDPARLGSFWWMVLATEGLPEPAWLTRAHRRSPDRPD